MTVGFGAIDKKKEIRQQVLAVRNILSTDEVAVKSRMINRVLDTISPLYEAKVIMGYAPFRNEVDIFPWLLTRMEAGSRILLPRVIAGTGEMEAVPLAPDEPMTVNKLGVSEPTGTAVPPEEIDAVLVPGVAFDQRGYRLGYGKGFYDRYLPQLRPGTLIYGIAFELQIVPQLPRDEHDYRLPRLVTESGIKVTN